MGKPRSPLMFADISCSKHETVEFFAAGYEAAA
jgi:hypothetical protein